MEEVPAVLEVSWAQVYHTLQLIINPNAEGLGHRGDTADNRPGFPRDLVDFWQDIEVWELQGVVGLDDAGQVSWAKEFLFKEESRLGIVASSIVDKLSEDGAEILLVDCQGVGHVKFLVVCKIKQVVVQGAAYIEGGFHDGGSKVFVSGSHYKFAFFLDRPECSEFGTGEVRLMVEATTVMEEIGSASLEPVDGMLHCLWGWWWVPFAIFYVEFGVESFIIEVLVGNKIFDPKILS